MISTRKKIVFVSVLGLAFSCLLIWNYIFHDGMVSDYFINKKSLVKLTKDIQNIDELSSLCLYENNTKYIEARLNNKYKLYTNNKEKINKTREVSNLVDRKNYDNKYYDLDVLDVDKNILEESFNLMKRTNIYCVMKRKRFFEIYIKKGSLDRYYGYILYKDNYQKNHLKNIFLSEYRYASLGRAGQDLSIHQIQGKWFWFTYSE